MTTKRRRVGPEDIVAINEAYVAIGTYAGAGRATGWSGGTVKRYIIPNYVPIAEREVIEFDEIVLPESNGLDENTDWSKILLLTEEEQKKMKDIESIMTI